jgi:hypothetical protein
MIKFLRYFLPLVVLAIGTFAIAIVINMVNEAGGVNTIGQFLLVSAILIFFAGVTLTAAHTVWEEAIFYDDENL